MHDADELKYWLAFSLVPGISGRRVANLYDRLGALSAAWHAPEAELRNAGLDGQSLTNLLKTRQSFDFEGVYKRVEQLGASVLAYPFPGYPPPLRDVPDAPPVLYMRGALMPTDERAIAIVGTRKATRYGIDASYQLARELAEAGVTVVSGLAQGIDAAAHRGALDGGGRTIAVLGNGIDSVYPSQHRDLANQILRSGAVLSEFPIGAKPEAHHFPRRNRVISGLSRGVLIVEAPEKSGALITASAALEQGRDVFAVPGSIHSTASAGANRLIQDGAKLIMNARDILEELYFEDQHLHTGSALKEKEEGAAEPISFDSPVEQQIFSLLSNEPTHVDDLIRISQCSAGDVLASLTLLELKDLARNVGGMQYCTGRAT